MGWLSRMRWLLPLSFFAHILLSAFVSKRILGNDFAPGTSKSSKLAPSETPYRDFLESLPWNQERQWDNGAWRQLILGLLEFNYMEPLVPINDTCTAPPLPSTREELPDNFCSRFSKTAGFDTTPRETPARIGHAINLGFDVDVLEIHLNEIYDLVDKFFLIEWTESHNRLILKHKPLTWERIKNQPRFAKFSDKVVHFIMDDADSAVIQNVTKEFAQEHYQSAMRWRKIVQWNNYTGFFGPNDVIGFGDADEIPARHNVHLLRHCQMNEPRVDVGIWFPLGGITNIYCPTYIPIQGKPCSFGDPTFWKFEAAFNKSLYLLSPWPKKDKNRKRQEFPNRMWGLSGPYLLGGIHMSHYSYLPMSMLKVVTGTEMKDARMEKNRQILSDALFGDSTLEAYQALMAKIPPGHRTRPLSEVHPAKTRDIVHYPWFYQCNRARYPRWETLPDSRLGRLDR